MPQQRKRVTKRKKVQQRRRRTTKEPVLTKIDFWAIAAKEVYDACVRAGFDEGTAMAFAMDRTSYPEWIVPADDPIRQQYTKGEDEE